MSNFIHSDVYIMPFRAENGTHWNCTGGAAKFIDVAVFGEEHIYQHPTSIQVYGGVAHDPEGLLGTLNRCLGSHLKLCEV